jgi:hypothetical protein
VAGVRSGSAGEYCGGAWVRQGTALAMKRYDPAEHYGEEHVTPKELAAMLKVSSKTAARIMRQSPLVLSLPRVDVAHKRKQQTLRLPISEARRLYAEMRYRNPVA